MITSEHQGTMGRCICSMLALASSHIQCLLLHRMHIDTDTNRSHITSLYPFKRVSPKVADFQLTGSRTSDLPCSASCI